MTTSTDVPFGLKQYSVPRSFNIVEINTEALKARIHQRHMVNRLFNLPVWGPGHFNSTNTSYIDVSIAGPLEHRPTGLTEQLLLERADVLIGQREWLDAVEILSTIKHVPLARPLLTKAAGELGDSRRTIDVLWPPQNTAEAVTLGGAILDVGKREEGIAFLALEMVAQSNDASVRNIARRVQERWKS